MEEVTFRAAGDRVSKGLRNMRLNTHLKLELNHNKAISSIHYSTDECINIFKSFYGEKKMFPSNSHALFAQFCSLEKYIA